MLFDISEFQSTLSPAESRVARFVLADPEAFLHKSLATIARQVGVSEPTVVRFCRSVGSNGLPDFKMKLARSLSHGAPYVHASVETGDDIRAVVRKVCSASMAAVDMRDALDLEALQQATAAIVGARRIDCYGVGGSAVAALDAYQKFMRLGVPTQFTLDTHLQTVSAATLQPGDVALVFSHTGQIRDTVRAARVARERAATVIGITRSDTELAALCTISITVDPIEDTFVYAPMVARVAHLVVVDILATSVALALGPQISEQFKRVKESLREQWIEPEPVREAATTRAQSSRRRS